MSDVESSEIVANGTPEANGDGSKTGTPVKKNTSENSSSKELKLNEARAERGAEFRVARFFSSSDSNNQSEITSSDD